MANEVIFQTRIQSKHDTLANWQAIEATFKPLAGEIIIYEIPSDDTSITNPPATLIKVGDGTNYLKDLKYLAARSADVASFLKNDNDGNVWTKTKFEAWIKSLVTIDDVDTSAFALVSELEKVAGDLQTETERATAAEEKALADAKEYTDGLNTAMDTRMQTVEGKAHEHANKDELDKISAGDKVKWDAMEQNAKDYADGLNKEMDGRVDALEAKFGDGEGTVEAQIAAAVATEKERAEGVESGLNTRIETIDGDYLKSTDKKELQDQITINANAIERLTNGVSADEVDGVNDLIAYVNEHGTEVTGMKNDIKANSEAIAAEKERAEGVEGGLAERLTAVEEAIGTEGSVAGLIADALEEAKGYTDTEVKELADGAVATNASEIAGLKEKVGEKAVSEQINDKVTELNLPNTYDAKGSAAAVQEALEAYKESNDEAVADIDAKVDALEIQNLGQTGYFILSCGTSTENI